MIRIVSLVVLSSLANLCHGTIESNRNKVIIDTDAGADDAVGLLLALMVPEKVQILAITCTYGNTWVNNVEKNVLKILTIANQSDIPVYSGADKPLYNNYTATYYFGKDGLNDIQFERQIEGSIDRSKHAALAMIDLVNKYPGEVSIVSLGPFTNVALASSLDPNFSRKVKRFYAMGRTPERSGFNVFLDPESHAIFLKTQTTETKLITSHSLVTKCEVPKRWRKVLRKRKSELVRFVVDVESATLQNATMWRLSDVITVATFIWPELVVNSSVTELSFSTCNTEDRRKNDAQYEQYGVEIVEEFDVEGLKKKLLQYFV